jgi:hypothetical protein
LTLFGRTLGAEEIATLALLLTSLVYWLFVYRGERGWARWFSRWEADRKARRQAELAAEQKSDPDAPRGPWT